MMERVRGSWTAVQSRVTRKALWRATLLLTLAAVLAIVGEALIRARLAPAASRLVTTLYTRPVAWHPGDIDPADDSDGAAAIPIGTLDGSAVEERIPVTLDQVPASLVQAVLAIEDQRFYSHHGIDVRRIAGALVANIRAGGVVQGGSTLTQQLAKNLFLTSARTPLRKIREAAMALVLEARYDKRTILTAYLNEIYLGQDGARAIHGVGAAAHYYLGTSVRHLSLAESAQLAAMISAPNRNTAVRHADAARDRRDLVLQLMVDQHRVSAAAAAHARNTDVVVRLHPAIAVDGRYFRDVAAAGLGREVPARGAAVYTTLDAALQQAAEHAMTSSLDRLKSHDVEAALVAIDPRTGEVLALVGGRDYGRSQFNRATEAHRQPGSAFKPIVALTALARGADSTPRFTLASVVEDEPLKVATPSGPWEPADYDQDFRGPVTVRQAMEESLNVPFARIGLAVGPDKVVTTARELGITSPLAAVPSIALGSSGVTLLELVRAYGVLADGGQLAPSREVIGVARGEHDTMIAAPAVPRQVVDPAVAYLVTTMLEGVVHRGTGHALDADDHLGGIAGKTGTSNDWRDAWFIAYSPDLVVGAWVGFDDERPLRMTGATAALPVVASFLAQVSPEDGWPAFEVPDGVVGRYDGSESDESADCGGNEVFLEGTGPSDDGDCRPMEIRGIRGLEQLDDRLQRSTARWLGRLLSNLRIRIERGGASH
jgi:penicillin-binding protein 1B